MKNKKIRKNYRPVFLGMFILVIFFGSFFLFYKKTTHPEAILKSQSTSKQSSGDQKIITEYPTPNNQIEQEEEPPKKQTPDPNLKTPKNISGDINNQGAITGAITALRLSPDKNKLIIRTNIDQKIPFGICHLKIYINQTIIHEESANVAQNPASSTCEGFDIPIQKIKLGLAKIEIVIKYKDKIGIIKGEVKI